jgi:hypothetical protein
VNFSLPTPQLRAYVSGYHRYELVRGPGEERFEDVFFPAWSNIRFTLHAEPVADLGSELGLSER